MAKKTSQPGRTLLTFFIAVAVLYGLAALGGTAKPKLGLDLEGGTRITLTAISGVSPSKLQQARGIIDQRVNANGVTESEVTTQGSKNIIVEIPGKNSKSLVDSVKRTAQLRFRIVAAVDSGIPVPAPTTSPGASPSTSPTATPSGTVSPAAPTSSSTATPKPRVAPHYADDARNKKKKTTPTATPTPTATATPGATPTAPAQTSKGASVDDPIAWGQDPGDAWKAKFAAFTCPPKGQEAAPVVDNPSEPLLTCNDDGLKFLLSKTMIEGTQLKSASYGIPQASTSWAVDLKFKSSARKTFADATRALYNNGGQFAIVLDGKVISYAGVNQPILDGNAEITGTFSEAEARSLSTSLKYGALPVRFADDPTVEVVGPSLAGSQLSAGIFAGIIGLLIVMVYCLLYYRGLGLVVIASLLIAGMVTYATVLVLAKAAGFTLTLPGIAGLIVAVGITADSFIVYFERIRDEMRTGKSMRVAVEAGWVRARNTCLAADAVSFLAAVVLYIFAIGVVRGFAFALGISTVIDVIVFFFFTKPMVSLLARRRYFSSGSRFSGLSPETLGIDEPGRRQPQLTGGAA
ncbi:MAG: protein translocase subunit SecD [Propionibacteriales bacterium]|nr:protein translocase subunit SecD [Propionibacteriales bacterium]